MFIKELLYNESAFAAHQEAISFDEPKASAIVTNYPLHQILLVCKDTKPKGGIRGEGVNANLIKLVNVY